MIAHHWSHGCGPMGISEGRAGRLLARPHDAEEAAHARGYCARQQDGAWHLGHADKGRGLPESGDGVCMTSASEAGLSGM